MFFDQKHFEAGSMKIRQVPVGPSLSDALTLHKKTTTVSVAYKVVQCSGSSGVLTLHKKRATVSAATLNLSGPVAYTCWFKDHPMCFQAGHSVMCIQTHHPSQEFVPTPKKLQNLPENSWNQPKI
jgi:hypothetical protein